MIVPYAGFIGPSYQSLANWPCRQCSLDCPMIFLDSVIKSIWFYLQGFRPIRNALCFVVESNENRKAGISALFGASGPSAIIFGIPSIVIDSFKTVAGAWSRADVISKCFVITPLLTHSNATSTVVVPINRGWIGAALDHACPNLVFSGVVLAVDYSKSTILGMRNIHSVTLPYTFTH